MSTYVVRVTFDGGESGAYVTEDTRASWPVPGRFSVGGLSSAARMTAAEAVAAVVLVRGHVLAPWQVEAIPVDLDGYPARVAP